MTETNPILAGIRQDLTDDTTYGQLAQRLVSTSLDLDAGKFDAESTPQDRRAAGVVLEYLCNVPISEAYNALQGSEPLIDLVDHYIPGGKFNSLDESFIYDLADNWSGDVQSTTGAYALVESHGDHINVTEDELGLISLRFVSFLISDRRVRAPGTIFLADFFSHKGSVPARGGRSLSNLVGRYPMGREALSPKFSCGTTVSSEIWTSKVFDNTT